METSLVCRPRMGWARPNWWGWGSAWENGGLTCGEFWGLAVSLSDTGQSWVMEGPGGLSGTVMFPAAAGWPLSQRPGQQHQALEMSIQATGDWASSPCCFCLHFGPETHSLSGRPSWWAHCTSFPWEPATRDLWPRTRGTPGLSTSPGPGCRPLLRRSPHGLWAPEGAGPLPPSGPGTESMVALGPGKIAALNYTSTQETGH